MYNTKRQEEKIIRVMTEPERKPRKKTEKQIFFLVKKPNKKSKRK